MVALVVWMAYGGTPGIDLCIGEIIIVICGEFLCKTRGTYRSLICSIINGGDFVDGKNLKGELRGSTGISFNYA